MGGGGHRTRTALAVGVSELEAAEVALVLYPPPPSRYPFLIPDPHKYIIGIEALTDVAGPWRLSFAACTRRVRENVTPCKALPG